MRKRFLLVLLAMVLVVSLAAFAACAGEEEAPPDEGDVWQWPDRLLVTAMSTRSPIYGSFVAWTTPLAEDTGVTFRVITEADSRLQQVWVKEGRFFALAPHQNRSMMYGIEGFARRDWGAWQSRIWMPAGIAYWGPTVLADSGIETIYDLKPGMKGILITMSEEPQQSMYAFLGWANVNPDDITWVPLGDTSQMARFLQDGKGDFALGYHTTPTWYEVEASPHGLRWLEMDPDKDPEAAKRFLEWYPWTGFGTASGGLPTAEGVTMAMTIPPYITSANIDSELIYRIVKWMDENYDRFKDGSPWCATTTIANLMELADHHYEPIHDGAVRYLEEIGLWTEELEARRQYNIEQLTMWVDGYQDAITEADAKGLNVDPEDEEWKKYWDDYKRINDLPMLAYYQGPGVEQPGYFDFYSKWEKARPTW